MYIGSPQSHTSEKPVWGAPERNKDTILKVLQHHVDGRKYALEVGSGTGQHAVHFAQQLPDLVWQCTDQADYLEGITQWVQEANLLNLPMPLEFDVNASLPDFKSIQNPSGTFDLIYTANTLHIMSWETVQQFFRCMSAILNPKACVMIYGPFNYGGRFTSESNAKFDVALKEKDPSMGIRDSEAVVKVAKDMGLSMKEDVEMPANNRCLVFFYD